MKRILVLLMLFCASIVAVGCGGGGTTTPSSTTPSGTTTTDTGSISSTGSSEFVPSTLSKGAPKGINGMLPDENAVNIKFTPNDDTPSFFKNDLRQKKPIFIEFYAENDIISDSMAVGIGDLQARYQDRVVFLLLNGNRPQTYGSLSQQLPLTYTPQVFVFNSDSTIIRNFAGYADKEVLEQAIYDALARGF